MASELLHPYAYDEDLRDYLAPDDKRVVRGRAYKIGFRNVYLRDIKGKRLHFAERGSSGGGGPESYAHIYAKKFYKEKMGFFGVVARQHLLVRFETCILEQRLDERTPDLTATISECWPPFFPQGSKFLLEIHAKNSVFDNPGRPQALARIGVPCIEVDLPLTAINWKFRTNFDPDIERRRFEAYMNAVLRAPIRTRWIVPDIAPIFTTPGPAHQLIAS